MEVLISSIILTIIIMLGIICITQNSQIQRLKEDNQYEFRRAERAEEGMEELIESNAELRNGLEHVLVICEKREQIILDLIDRIRKLKKKIKKS